MANDLNDAWRFRHSKMIAAPAEKSERLKVKQIDFGGTFEDDPEAVREGRRLNLVTQRKLLAHAIAASSRR
tara:strand:- start:61 stop:273 length:213 start_codon:yes stop_codon:yes gene_type:complete